MLKTFSKVWLWIYSKIRFATDQYCIFVRKVHVWNCFIETASFRLIICLNAKRINGIIGWSWIRFRSHNSHILFIWVFCSQLLEFQTNFLLVNKSTKIRLVTLSCWMRYCYLTMNAVARRIFAHRNDADLKLFQNP